MAEDILETYHRLLESAAVPFAPITAPEDWHLTLFAVTSFQPEEIFDVDHRGGGTLFYRTRLLPSLWSAVWDGRNNSGKVAPVATERACAKLEPVHGLVGLVRDEYVFRMEDLKTLGLDGTSFILVHAYHGGARRVSAWEPLRDARWARLWAEIEKAATLLPRRN
jgi:hypothetical protein